MGNIHVNQLGYQSNNKKVFYYTGEGTEFKVLNKINDQVVLKGNMISSSFDESTGEEVAKGDFSDIKTPGEYYILIDDKSSYSFKIDDKVYEDVKDGLLKAFYLQRCGMELNEEYAGKWKHAACHMSEGILYDDPNTKIEISGGWHDAGDYGRYVVAASKAVADLLLSYEFFKEAFQNEINIPRSSDKLPDILSEAKYELDWLFKMQNTKTGAVYHKVATQFFPDMIMPEEDLEPLVIYPESSPATGDFAAVMALASRIYKNNDSKFAEKCLLAAEKAWNWLINNPEPALFKNPPNMNSGEYGDYSDLDERYWAAAELYRATGKIEYHDNFKNIFSKLSNLNSLGWADMGGYGTIAYLFTEKSKVDSEIYEVLKTRFIEKAEAFKEVSEKDGYNVTLKANEYIWGSNMEILNNAMHLIICDMLVDNHTYKDAAIHQWNYLLGANSLSQCYLTGYGSKPIMHPHHRPSEGDGILEPVPGLVSGGPCSALLDARAEADCKGKAPAKCFTDNMESYSTNEITIYWNSPAVFVAGYLNYK